MNNTESQREQLSESLEDAKATIALKDQQIIALGQQITVLEQEITIQKEQLVSQTEQLAVKEQQIAAQEQRLTIQAEQLSAQAEQLAVQAQQLAISGWFERTPQVMLLYAYVSLDEFPLSAIFLFLFLQKEKSPHSKSPYHDSKSLSPC